MIKQLKTILSLNCREASRLLSDRSERSLLWYERLALRLHLLICRGCRRYRSYLAIIHTALRLGPKPGETDSVRSELDADMLLTSDAKTRLRNLLKQS